MQVELTEREREELLMLVKNAETELKSEIHHSFYHETKDALRERHVLLETLVKRLEAAA